MSTPAIEVAAFYQFAPLPGYAALREPIRAACAENGVRGICLLAAEGVNGTLAGTPGGLAAALAEIRRLTGLDVPHKSSFTAEIPFKRLKVRLKKEIVTLGVAVDPTARIGEYVAPKDWNALIADPEVIVVMGNTSLFTLTGSRGILRARGNWSQALGKPLLPMTHPAYLLRNPAAKREAWADLLSLQARLR